MSESSEYTDGDDHYLEINGTSPPKSQSPDGLTDSMTAVADDLCSSNQLRINSSGETNSEHLLLADYTKHEAKQAMTVPVSNNNGDAPQGVTVSAPKKSDVSDNSSQSSKDINKSEGLFNAGQSSNINSELSPLCYKFNNARMTPTIDLSAITEEADETSTSMHLSCKIGRAHV